MRLDLELRVPTGAPAFAQAIPCPLAFLSPTPWLQSSLVSSGLCGWLLGVGDCHGARSPGALLHSPERLWCGSGAVPR